MQKATKVKDGQRGIVAALNGDARFLSRITAIGLTPGCPVEMLRNEVRQPILLYCRDTMIAVCRREGEKILLKMQAADNGWNLGSGKLEESK
jgi:ferrous iron transport protein A